MAGVLTVEQLERYCRDGYLAPLEALSQAEAEAHADALQRLIGVRGWPLDAATRHKPHLLQKGLSDLVHHPAIVEAVTSILGPDVSAWRTGFFIKAPRDGGFVAWHQDSIYWGLEPHDVATAWVALTDSTTDNGCVRVAAGSHVAEIPHGRSAARRNSLLRGQVATVEVPPEQSRAVVLRAGQFSLHHVRLLHSSPANPSEQWRAGFVIRYIACHVRGSGARDSVTPVAGTDRYHHFDHEPIPRCDADPLTVAAHRRSIRRYTAEIARETLTRPSLANLATVGRIALNPRSYRGVIRYLRGGPRER